MISDQPSLPSPGDVTVAGLPKRRGRFDADAVEELMTRVRASYERLWDERTSLRSEVERLAKETFRSRELDRHLSDVLASAERAADDVKAAARREADELVADAKRQARDVVGQAEAERERLEADIQRLVALRAELRHDCRSFLLAALELAERGADGPEEAASDEDL